MVRRIRNSVFNLLTVCLQTDKHKQNTDLSTP